NDSQKNIANRQASIKNLSQQAEYQSKIPKIIVREFSNSTHSISHASDPKFVDATTYTSRSCLVDATTSIGDISKNTEKNMPILTQLKPTPNRQFLSLHDINSNNKQKETVKGGKSLLLQEQYKPSCLSSLGHFEYTEAPIVSNDFKSAQEEFQTSSVGFSRQNYSKHNLNHTTNQHMNLQNIHISDEQKFIDIEDNESVLISPKTFPNNSKNEMHNISDKQQEKELFTLFKNFMSYSQNIQGQNKD
ncbi:hypothetical protein HK096_001239, partial [Nowakowskiella sp. JEL0078]